MTSTASGAVSTSAPQIVTTTSPTPIVPIRNDPIIGVWRHSYIDEIIRFNADGTFIESNSYQIDYEDHKTCTYGTWYAKGNNSFATCTTAAGDLGESTHPTQPFSDAYRYNPAEKTIIKTGSFTKDGGEPIGENYDEIYKPYQGDVMEGCIPAKPVPVEGDIQIISKYPDWKSYGDFYVSGVVRNNVGRSVTVSVYVDAYDSNGVKVGTGKDIVTIDPYGKSKFEAIAFGEKGSSRGGSYRVYISSI